MTLTELSVFMRKQELELQLRTEKEKEEGEYWLFTVKQDPVIIWISSTKEPHNKTNEALCDTVLCSRISCKFLHP